MRNTKLFAAAMIVAAATTLSACGSSDSSDGDTDAGSALEPVAGLPAEFDKTWEVPALIGYPPFAFEDASGKLAGLDPGIIDLVAKNVGVKVNVTQVGFESQLLGLDQGKYVFVPTVNVNPERAEKYDFVSYYNDAYGLAAKKGTTIGDTLEDLCGTTLGVQSGDVAISELEKQSADVCESAGNEPIELSTFPNQPAAVTAVQSGRVDAVVGTLSGLLYLADQSGQVEVTGPKFLEAPLTLATLKDNGLAEYLKKAIDAMIADGSYAKVLEDNNLTPGAVTEAEINPGV